MSRYQLAQVNVGIIKGPMDSPVMAGFAAGLDRINALADGFPGFVWRLQTEEGNATSIRPFEDENLLINMSVWRDVEAIARLELLRAKGPTLEAFTFRSAVPAPDAAEDERAVDSGDGCPAT